MSATRRVRTPAAIASAAFALISATAAAQFDGSIAYSGCTGLVMDNRADGGEFFVIKTHNAGNGPDQHQDWLFDVTAKGGQRLPLANVGGATWATDDTFHLHTTPPEQVFVIVTYPNGRMAIDSSDTRGGITSLGVVQIQRVGDSLPVGVDNGIGLVLPGSASPYGASIAERWSGAQAAFPFGTSTGIELAFAPIAEINVTDIGGSGCTVGGEVQDQQARFGIITGYNVYRLEGVAASVPLPADFVGAWEYYCPLDSFDLNVADSTGSAGPDINGDGWPDGDGLPAPGDSRPDDLCGLQNPDGRPYSGDEVLIYQDSALNPDRTARISGTGPDRTGVQGYWYVIQPVVYQGATRLEDYDGLGFSDSDIYIGQHSMDTDADGLADSLDFDLDGLREFYSPQVVIGQTGLGLTNRGIPVLSAPVFGRINPAIALGTPLLAGQVIGSEVQLTFTTGFESAAILGYNVRRAAPDGATGTLVNATGPIFARGGDGNVYQLSDRLQTSTRSRRSARLAYSLEVVMSDGTPGPTFGPFVATGPSAPERRRR
jgi:hypothetical protein